MEPAVLLLTVRLAAVAFCCGCQVFGRARQMSQRLPFDDAHRAAFGSASFVQAGILRFMASILLDALVVHGCRGC